MPAAAVIPAPIAYIKVVAVKKLVVGFRDGATGPPLCGVYLGLRLCPSLQGSAFGLSWSARGTASFTVKKLECLKQALIAVNTLAWNNKIGLWDYFVGWRPR